VVKRAAIFSDASKESGAGAAIGLGNPTRCLGPSLTPAALKDVLEVVIDYPPLVAELDQETI
jgi:hypothetical protein